MIVDTKKDVLDTLSETIESLETKQYADLHMISDHLLHSITIHQEKTLIDLSIAIYVLNKILEKEKYTNHLKVKDFVKKMLHLFKDMQKCMQKSDDAGFEKLVAETLISLQTFSRSIKFYIDDLLHFAKIKKGTKLYEHGISLGKAAELVGVAKWDLMPAIGETAIHEQLVAPKNINEKRIAFTEKIFKKKVK